MTKRFHGELRKMTVVGASGRVFGDVDDVVIDETTWQATRLIVRVSSDAVADLGLEKPFWKRARLQIPTHQVVGASDVMVLRSTLEEIAQLVAMAEAEPE